MRILLNASNVGKGGATQVTNSICLGLNKISDVDFVVVLPNSLAELKEEMATFKNVEVFIHSVSRSKLTKITGREHFLDNLVLQKKIDCVLSVFGPTWWIPRCPHLAGFALAHLVMPESPYFLSMKKKEKLKSIIKNNFMRFFFKRCSRHYYTENSMITERLMKAFPRHKVYTVTNYYNQVFDQPEKWQPMALPEFDGCTILTLAAAYPHKNLEIAIPVARYLHDKYPLFRFRFVFSINEDEYPALPVELKEHFLFIGYVSIYKCPSLYQQSTIIFQPTLLECFTAAYPEAMVMKRPIVTTSMAFAKGLCGEAALYYSPMSAQDAADNIYTLYKDHDLQKEIVEKGCSQLKLYDTYEERVTKLIDICKDISNNTD